MKSHNFFIQTIQMLLEGQRFREAIELCEYAIANAVWEPAMERQSAALCRWNLAEICFYRVGDAERAREEYMGFLRYVDADLSMITDAPPLREVMEDMYCKACIDMGQLAVSYDEYFYYLKKSESVRALTPRQKDVMQAVESNRRENVSWCGNIVQLAQLDADAVESGNIDRIPPARAMYSLILLYPDTIASEADALETLTKSIANYSLLTIRLVGESVMRCSAIKHPANPDNYLFIYEQANALVKSYADDMETRAVAKEWLAKLAEVKTVMEKSKFFEAGYDRIAPPGAAGYIPPVILKVKIKINLGKPTGCMTVMAVMAVLGSLIAAAMLLVSLFSALT
jgi:hypothetical protein